MITQLRSALHATLLFGLIMGATACGGLDGLTPGPVDNADTSNPATDPTDAGNGEAEGADANTVDPVDPSSVNCTGDGECTAETIQAPEECMEFFCDTDAGTCASRHVADGTPCSAGSCQGGKCVAPGECGDGTCSADESAESCAEDCTAAEGCGDGVCDDEEDTETCPADCSVEPIDLSLIHI